MLGRPLIPHLRRVLFDLNRGEEMSEKARKALRVFTNFISALKIKTGDLEFSIDIEAETGKADTGDLEIDLVPYLLPLAKPQKIGTHL